MSGLGGSCGKSNKSNNSGSNNNKKNASISSGGICEPRRSNRVTKSFSHDGDIWQESLAVCESTSHKLVIRSYFLNTRTGKKAWDEPPTGATHIEQATGDMRKQAEMQLNEFTPGRRRREKNVTTAKKEKGGSSRKDNTTSQSKKKVGANGTSGLFRKILSDSKKNSIFDGIGKSSKKTAERQKKHQQQLENQRAKERSKQESKYMQIAISSSLNQQNIDNRQKKSTNKNYSTLTKEKGHSAARGYQEDPEALQLAMMLSISEVEQSRRKQSNNKEDLILRKVLEESQSFINSSVNRSINQEEKEWHDQRNGDNDWAKNIDSPLKSTSTTSASSNSYERHNLNVFEQHQQQRHLAISHPQQQIVLRDAPGHAVSNNTYQIHSANYIDINAKTQAIALYDPYGHGKSTSPSFDYSEISIPTTIVLNQDSTEKEEKKLRKMKTLEYCKRNGIKSCRRMKKKKMQDRAGLL